MYFDFLVRWKVIRTWIRTVKKDWHQDRTLKQFVFWQLLAAVNVLLAVGVGLWVLTNDNLDLWEEQLIVILSILIYAVIFYYIERGRNRYRGAPKDPD